MRSMTGCGRARREGTPWEVSVELKTVNHRFLDIACRLPRNIAFLDAVVRRELGAALRRGHADVFITVRNTEAGSAAVETDAPLARAYLDAARAVGEATGVAPDLRMRDLLSLEGVTRLVEPDMDEEKVSALCGEALREALAGLCAMRSREGAALRDDLLAHLEAAEALRGEIALHAGDVVADYRARLQERLARLPIEPVDPARLAQEVALLADKCAIDEELARLDAHFTQLRQWLTAPGRDGEAGVTGEIGKKMDFLIQEMNRETNTIGSKASSARIARLVVDLKSEIEKLREQVQNVE